MQKHFKNFEKRAPGPHALARVMFFCRIPRANLYDGMRNKRKRKCVQPLIAILTVTSPIVINVPTRGLLAVETKDSFVLWLAKFKYQKNCL